MRILWQQFAFPWKELKTNILVVLYGRQKLCTAFGNMPIANGYPWQINFAVLKYKSILTYKELFTI